MLFGISHLNALLFLYLYSLGGLKQHFLLTSDIYGSASKVYYNIPNVLR